MRAIEVDAGKRFFDIGLDDIAAAEPPSRNEFLAAITANMCWVIRCHDLPGSASEADDIAGYAIAEIADGAGHLHQVSVLDSYQGKGLGKALIAFVADWARAQGFATLTLTTFADVAWNGPLYSHLGFVEITPAPGTDLHQIRQAEIAAGLDSQPRIAMQLQL